MSDEFPGWHGTTIIGVRVAARWSSRATGR